MNGWLGSCIMGRNHKYRVAQNHKRHVLRISYRKLHLLERYLSGDPHLDLMENALMKML